MTAYDWLALGIVLACLLLSAFFAGSETALTASSRASMHRLEKQGNRRAALVNRLLDARERLIGALLLGNNAVNIAASSLATGVLLNWFGEVGVIYATVVMTALIVVLAEVLPKTAAFNSPDRLALWVAAPIDWTVRLLTPVLIAIEWVVRLLLRLFGMHVESESILSPHEEIRGTVDLLHREGGVERLDRDMLSGLLDLRDLTVSDVMIHRTEMITVCADDPPEQVVKAVLEAEVTRVPLWKGTPENIIGILHAKDLLRAIRVAGGDLAKIEEVGAIARPPWFVPEVRPLSEQLKAFRRRKTPFALVVDEYGEVMGLVTLEDILEEIVGDITDEHDVAVPGVRPQPDGSVNVDGGVPIRDLNRAMEWSLPDAEATTVAGLVIHEARSIPEPGQTFTFHGFRFRVLRRERNRITALRIMPLARKSLMKSA
jgi:Mg2+/Co2+ transporter CorB